MGAGFVAVIFILPHSLCSSFRRPFLASSFSSGLMTRIRTSRTETTLVRVAGDNNCTGGERQLYRWQGTTIQETTSVQVARHNKLYRWLEIATVQVAGDNCTGGRRQQLYRWQEITNCTCGRRQQIVQVAGDNKQVAGDNKLYRWQETTTESNCVGGRRNNCTGGRRQQLYRWQETTIGGRRQQLYRWQETTVLVAGDNNCIGGRRQLYWWQETTTVQVAGDNCTGGRRQQLYRCKPVSYTHLTLPTMAVV